MLRSISSICSYLLLLVIIKTNLYYDEQGLSSPTLISKYQWHSLPSNAMTSSPNLNLLFA